MTFTVTMTPIERFMKKVERSPDGCLVWTGGLNPDGYGRFRVGGSSNVRAHRWLFGYVHGYSPEAVMHLCDNRRCVEIGHLVPGTRSLNHADMMKKGRNVSVRKLDSCDRAQIVRDYRTGMVTQYELADAFGVAQHTVSRILREGGVRCPRGSAARRA